MSSGVTAERVYDALKRRLLSGALLPGEKLEPARLADDFSSSVTPVRDALHRLTGERLVETRTSDGFHLPLVTEPGLRDLYGWNAELVRLIARSWRRDAIGSALASDLPADLAGATRTLFDRFALRSANPEHREQIASSNDRLTAARHAEGRVLSELEDELRALAETFDREPASQLLQRIDAYHRRRYRAVPAIVRALYERA